MNLLEANKYILITLINETDISPDEDLIVISDKLRDNKILYTIANTEIRVSEDLLNIETTSEAVTRRYGDLLKQIFIDNDIPEVTDENNIIQRVKDSIKRAIEEESETLIGTINVFTNSNAARVLSKGLIDKDIDFKRVLLNILRDKEMDFEGRTGEVSLFSAELSNNNYKMDVSLIDKYNNRGQIAGYQLYLDPSDRNIREISNLVDNITYGIEKQLVMFSLLIALMVAKYNTNGSDENFLKTSHRLFNLSIKILDDLGDYDGLADHILEMERTIGTELDKRSTRYSYGGDISFLRRLLSNTTNYQYYYIEGFVRQVASTPELDIDYSAMTNEHLILFRTTIQNIVNTFARYVVEDDKALVAAYLFLGRRELKGKRATLQVLTEHFNLERLNEEISSRDL